MVRTAPKNGRDEATGLDRLREEFVDHPGAQTEHLADVAGGKEKAKSSSQFSSFAKGVRSVSQGGRDQQRLEGESGPSTRSWNATIQEQVTGERTVWTSDGARGSTRECQFP